MITLSYPKNEYKKLSLASHNALLHLIPAHRFRASERRRELVWAYGPPKSVSCAIQVGLRFLIRFRCTVLLPVRVMRICRQ